MPGPKKHGFQVDSQLEQLRRHPTPLLSGRSELIDFRDLSSSVQPSSLDLHVGDIYKPTGRVLRLEDLKPESTVVLKPGAAIVIATQEELNVPSDIAIISFPPARLSGKSILATNPGHVDPGYQGRMRVTLINMGRTEVALRTGDPLLTLLVYRLASAAEADYAARQASTNEKQKPPTGGALVAPELARKDNEQEYILEMLNSLAPDFMDFQTRATKIARKEALRRVGLAAIIATVITIVAGFLINQGNEGFKLDVIEKLHAFELRLQVIEEEQKGSSTIRDLESRIGALGSPSRSPQEEASP